MSDPMKPKAKSEETRDRILQAAQEMFHDRGFESTTMREIAVAAGVATGAAYYYFDSKDAIVLAFYGVCVAVATYPCVWSLGSKLPGLNDPLEHLWIIRWYASCLFPGKKKRGWACRSL